MGSDLHFTGSRLRFDGDKWDEYFDRWEAITGRRHTIKEYQWVCFDGDWYPPRQRMNWPRLLKMFHDGHVEWGAKVQRVQGDRYERETLVVVNGLEFG